MVHNPPPSTNSSGETRLQDTYKGKCGRNPTQPPSQQNSLTHALPFHTPPSQSSKTPTWNGGMTGLFKELKRPSSGIRTASPPITLHTPAYSQMIMYETALPHLPPGSNESRTTFTGTLTPSRVAKPFLCGMLQTRCQYRMFDSP